MKIYSFEKLEVWQATRKLTVFIYKLTSKFPNDEKFGLVSQMRRASLSISSNLAEGSSRMSKNDKAHFYTMAYSSALELLNQGIASNDLGFIIEDELVELRIQIDKITGGIGGLRKSLNL